MSLNNESSNSSSDDESFQSSKSIVFSSGRSLSPAWSRSSSMTSGISAISSASSESRKKFKAKFGPITRPTPTDLKTNDSHGDCKVQQQNSQNISPNPASIKSKNGSFLPPKIIRPVTNMPQPQGWITYSHTGPVYGPPVPHFPPPMMYYPSPLPPPTPVQMQMGYPMPCSVPMAPPGFSPIYSQPQVRYISVQTQYTYTWTYIDYV